MLFNDNKKNKELLELFCKINTLISMLNHLMQSEITELKQ